MKKTSLLPIALLIMLLWTGCTSRPEGDTSSKLAGIPFSEGQLYAAAYLGYQEAEDLDYYAQQYLDSSQIPTYYLSDGDYYLIIPRFPGTAMSLYQNDVETGQSVLLLQDPDCRPFVLQCNVSDIFCDATIRLTYGQESTEFSPFLSLMDGSVDVGERGLLLTGQPE